jgi:hypothetical protein
MRQKQPNGQCPHFALLSQFDPLGKHLQDPFPMYALARQKQPVFYSSVLGAWIITRYEDVREAAARHDLFSSEGALRPVTAFTPAIYAILAQGIGFDPTEINSDPPQHARYRIPLPLCTPKTNKWGILAIVAIGVFMATLDPSIVTISLPTVARAFGVPLSSLVEWVIIVYLVTTVAVLLTAGRLADMIGHKAAWIAGLVLFTGSSALCGLAPSLIFLVSARALQGIFPSVR